MSHSSEVTQPLDLVQPKILEYKHHRLIWGLRSSSRRAGHVTPFPVPADPSPPPPCLERSLGRPASHISSLEPCHRTHRWAGGICKWLGSLECPRSPRTAESTAWGHAWWPGTSRQEGCMIMGKCPRNLVIRQTGKPGRGDPSKPARRARRTHARTHIHEHAHTRAHVHSHTHVHTHAHMCVHTQANTHTCMHTCTCTQAHTDTRARTQIHTDTHKHMQVHTRAHTHECAHTGTCARTHTYIHPYTRI